MRARTYSDILTSINSAKGEQTFEIPEEVDDISFQEIVEQLESNPDILVIEYDSERPLRFITAEWRGA